jgi:hypothetical protein
MPTLQSRLNDIAESFTAAILDVIKGASLQDLQAYGGHETGNGRGNLPSASAPAAARRARSSGRLPRRSTEDIAKALDDVVGLVKRHKDGLRAEQIRQQLGMQAKEMPRVLKEGLSKKLLKSKGQKRATTYLAR